MTSANKLKASCQTPRRKIGALRREFGKLLMRMQTPKARKAMKAAFNATPEQLGKAAVAARKKR